MGLIGVTFTDKIAVVFGLPWGAYPLTIHSAAWGILLNLGTVVLVSFLMPDPKEEKDARIQKHAKLKALAGVPPEKRKFIPVAIFLTVFWILSIR